MQKKNIPLKLIQCVFASVLLIFCFFSICHTKRYYIMFRYNFLHAIISTMIVGVLYYFWNRILNRINSTKLFVVIMAAWMIMNALIVFKVATPIGWDSLELTNAAQFEFDNAHYFATYPNNIFPALILMWWFKISKFLPFSPYRDMLLLNLAFVYLSMMLTLVCANKLGGNRLLYKVAFWLITILGMNPTLSVIYTDTLALPFPIAFFLCTLEAMETEQFRKKLWSVTIAGIVLVMGMLIKPTVIIVAIACFACCLLSGKMVGWRAEVWGVIALGIAVSIATYSGIQLVEKPIKTQIARLEPNTKSKGMLHYIGMGLCPPEGDTDGFGDFRESEVEWTNTHINDDNYKKEAIKRIEEKIVNDGIVGLTEFEWDKLVWMGTDGTFAYGMEGGYHLEEQSSQNTLRGKLQNCIYVETPFFTNWYGNFLQGMWILFLVIGAFQGISLLMIWEKMENDSDLLLNILICELSIIGMVLFLLIFENRSRYLFLYLPLLFLACEAPTVITSSRIFTWHNEL